MKFIIECCVSWCAEEKWIDNTLTHVQSKFRDDSVKHIYIYIKGYSSKKHIGAGRHFFFNTGTHTITFASDATTHKIKFSSNTITHTIKKTAIPNTGVYIGFRQSKSQNLLSVIENILTKYCIQMYLCPFRHYLKKYSNINIKS